MLWDCKIFDPLWLSLLRLAKDCNLSSASNRLIFGSGGGLVVSVLVFYPDGLSSNPAEAYSFSVNFVFEANKNIQKEAVIYKKAVASSPVDVIGDNAMVGCCKSRDEF